MATIQQQALHWRDQYIEKSEVISDAWQVFLAYSGRAAEIILFLCMVFSLMQMIPFIHLPDWLTGSVMVLQMVVLDIAGFGLNTLARQVKRAGDEETAKKAASVGTFLIGIMIATVLSVAIKQMFAPKFPALGEWMTYIDYGLILTRVVMTVVYGKVIHVLRESKQELQMQADTTLTELREELSQLRQTLQKERQAVSKEKTEQTATIERLQTQVKQMEETQISLLNGREGESSLISKLQNQVSQLSSSLEQEQRDMGRVIADLQTANGTIERLQIAGRETANLREQVQDLANNLQSANQQRADLSEKLEKTKKKLAGLQKSDEQPGRIQRSEASGDNITLLEKARQKSRMSHAEVLAFMDQHSDLTRSEVAAKLEISERKVYDAVAWRRDNLQGGNAASQ